MSAVRRLGIAPGARVRRECQPGRTLASPLKCALCNVQTICRTVHFGPSVPEVVDGDATLAPFGLRGTSILDHPAPKGGGCSFHLGKVRAEMSAKLEGSLISSSTRLINSAKISAWFIRDPEARAAQRGSSALPGRRRVRAPAAARQGATLRSPPLEVTLEQILAYARPVVCRRSLRASHIFVRVKNNGRQKFRGEAT